MASVINTLFSCGPALVVELLYVLLLLLFICCPFGGIDACEASKLGRFMTTWWQQWDHLLKVVRW